MMYFAYGSNLDYPQMMARCPRARLIGPARLDGYRICFPRRSFVRATAVASIEPSSGSSVWGALYEIEEGDVDRLDSREGYYPGAPAERSVARRIPVTVKPSDGEPVEAMTYVLKPVADPGLPSADYLSVIINGAIACRAPEDYIAGLMAQPTSFG